MVAHRKGMGMLKRRLVPSALALALLAGCASSTSTPAAATPASQAPAATSTAATTPAPSTAGATTLSFGMNSSASLLPTAKLLEDNFAKTHPEVKVDVQLIANNDIAPTFYKEAAAGTLPDVVFTADSY